MTYLPLDTKRVVILRPRPAVGVSEIMSQPPKEPAKNVRRSENIDFVVIYSGYASRIVDKYVLSVFDCKVHVKVQDSYGYKDGHRVKKRRSLQDYTLNSQVLKNSMKSCDDHDCSQGCETNWRNGSYILKECNNLYIDEDIKDRSNVPIFSEDNIGGDGIYIFDDNSMETVNFIRSALIQDDRSTHGIVVFKCKTMKDAVNRADELRMIHYCACFETPTDMSIIDAEDTQGKTARILYMSFDTESG